MQNCDMKFDDKERLKRHSRKAHSENEDFTPNAQIRLADFRYTNLSDFSDVARSL